MTIQRTDSIKEFGGFLNQYTHDSAVLNCEMTFSVYLPPQAEEGDVPALYWFTLVTWLLPRNAVLVAPATYVF